MVPLQSDCAASLAFLMTVVNCRRISRNLGEERRKWYGLGRAVGLTEAAMLDAGAGMAELVKAIKECGERYHWSTSSKP